MEHDEGPKDEGSVWASYSDLFTNVAIIFLVMFVFALLKAGISKIETVAVKAKHENELKAKLSQKDIEKSEAKIKKVEKSLDEMKDVERLVDTKMKEIENFAQKLQKNKEVLHDLIEEQRRKDSLINVVNQNLELKTKEFEDLNLESKKLQEKIKKTELTNQEIVKKLNERTIASVEEQKIKDNLKKQLDENRVAMIQLESEKQLKDQKIEELEKHTVTISSLERQKQEYEKKIKDYNTQVVDLSSSKELLEKMVQENYQLKKKAETELSELKRQVSGQVKEKDSLLMKMTSLSSSNSKLTNDLERMNKAMENRLAEMEHYKKMHQDGSSSNQELKNELARSNEQMKNLGKAFSEMKSKLRSSVADSLKKKFAANNIPVNVNGQTGNIVLLMDSNFLFKKNSAELSDGAKLTLTKIIPIYADSIFKDEKMASRIDGIQVTGHASPSFKQKFVDPKTDFPEAYSHNLKLSAMRATTIANYMMGAAIGNYKYKGILKEKIHAIGRGYMDPIEKMTEKIIKRELASVKESNKESQNCGPYDCNLSQRVEIGFSLKDDLKAMEKIINMAGER